MSESRGERRRRRRRSILGREEEEEKRNEEQGKACRAPGPCSSEFREHVHGGGENAFAISKCVRVRPVK